MSMSPGVIEEIETIEAEVELVRACVQSEGRAMSSAERGYLDELLLERADLYRAHQQLRTESLHRARLQSLYTDALQRADAIRQMQAGGLAVASAIMLTAVATPAVASGELILAVWGGVALGGFRFARGLTDYLRR